MVAAMRRLETQEDRVDRILFGVGFAVVLLFWKWLLWAAALFVVLVTVLWVVKQVRLALWETEQRREAICRRADEQHALVLAGDPRGTYGA